jgi:general secretion pathway protein D
MNNSQQITAVLVAGILLLPPIPAAAGTRKGDRLRNQARTEETRGNFDHALELAESALGEDSSDPAYLLLVRRLRFEDGGLHVKNGQKLRGDGKLDEALAEFQRAYGIDPASDVAAQEIRRTKEMIERAKNPGAAALKPEDKALTPSALARKETQERIDSLLPVPELRPLNNDLIDLKMANQRPRILFETVAKIAGVNILFDPEYDQQQTIRATGIDLTRTTLDQALDQLSVLTKSFWKPLSSNAIFVTVDNPTKRREYAEQVVRVFYLSNITTPQEMQEMLTVLRTVVDVQKVFSYTSQNALIVRAEADTMAVVEKLIAGLDKARAEVVIDILVMEVSSTHTRNITAGFATSGLTTSATFSPRPGITTPGIQSATSTNTTGSSTSSTTTTGTSTGITTPATTGSTSVTSIPLSALGHISSADYSLTTLPGATLEAVLSDSATRVLQSPQIRAVDNAKASLKIGDKVPTATGSFQPGVAGVGVSPLVNTQFTYLDVGVNVEITPKVHEDNEVSLHLDLDVSQVKDYVTIGGISEPEISQNKATADIRLREGEVNLIGGIMQQTDSKATTGIPGLSSIPILGRLFSGENVEKDRTELVIALIPHIVRGQEVSDSNLHDVAVGNATQIKVSRAPRPVVAVSQPAPARPPAAGVPTIAAPPVTAPPATAPTVPLPPNPGGPPATAPVLPATPPAPPPPAGQARLSFSSPSPETQLSGTVTVTLTAENVANLAAGTAQLRFDPGILRLNSVVAGDLAQRNAAPLDITKNILNDTGQADLAFRRAPNEGGASGTGGLFTVVFQAVGRGTTSVTLSSSALNSAASGPIVAAPPSPLSVTVR